jgi:hypothetical protein
MFEYELDADLIEVLTKLMVDKSMRTLPGATIWLERQDDVAADAVKPILRHILGNDDATGPNWQARIRMGGAAPIIRFGEGRLHASALNWGRHKDRFTAPQEPFAPNS